MGACIHSHMGQRRSVLAACVLFLALGLTNAAATDAAETLPAEVDERALKEWKAMESAVPEAFWEYAEKILPDKPGMAMIIIGPEGPQQGAPQPVEVLKEKLGVDNWKEPLQAGPRGKDDVLPLTALPKLLWQPSMRLTLTATAAHHARLFMLDSASRCCAWKRCVMWCSS